MHCLTVFFAFLASSFPLYVDEVDQERVSLPQSSLEKDVKIDSSIDGTSIVDVDLGDLELGTLYRVTLNVTNALDVATEFESATASCSCMTLKIPKLALAPKESTHFTFGLSVSPTETKPKKSLTVEVDLKGGGKLILRMKSHIKGIVSISEKSLTLDLDESGKPFVKEIPVVASKPELLQEAVVSVEGDLKDVCRAEISPEKQALVVNIVATTAVTGEVSIRGNGFAAQTLSIAVRKKPWVRIQPSALVFGSINDSKISATMMVKFDVSKQPISSDLSIVCSLGKKKTSSLSQKWNRQASFGIA
jgi:hypothetical protein